MMTPEELSADFQGFCALFEFPPLYQYQATFARHVLWSLWQCDGEEYFLEVPRQAGKTEIDRLIAAFLMVMFPTRYKHPRYLQGAHVGFYAPLGEQASTGFTRLCEGFNRDILRGVFGIALNTDAKTSIGLSNGSDAFSMTASETTRQESKTLNLEVLDEAQSIADTKLTAELGPMRAAVGGVAILSGKPTLGVRSGHFKMGLDRYRGTNRSTVVGLDAITAVNATYAANVEKARREWGEDSPEFRSQYLLEWIDTFGQFTSFVELQRMASDQPRVSSRTEGEQYAAWDVGKSPDSTVVTVAEWDGQTARILEWLELTGENYESQHEMIKAMLARYQVRTLVIDSVGVGDPVFDRMQAEWLRRIVPYEPVSFKWTSITHDAAFKQLSDVFQRSVIRYPKDDSRECRHFEDQLLALTREYRNGLLRCHHPPGKHDDYVSSLAMLMQVMEYRTRQVATEEHGIGVVSLRGLRA